MAEQARFEKLVAEAKENITEISPQDAAAKLRGEPIARVEPVVPPKREVRLGALKGWMEIKGDIIRSDLEKDFLVQ
jgi:hypothetical protein